MHQRVVPGSLTVLFKSSVDYRTLVCGCRIAIYRPRRKKGRIKCDAEKRHSVVGEQKIEKKAGDVLRFDSNGDKNILSTPSVTNGLLSTRDPSLPDSATIAQLSLNDEPNAAAASQSERRTRRGDMAHGSNEAHRAIKENRQTLSSIANGTRKLSFVLVC